jgi:succinate dehydrogenase/fumarate reductase flavoprotein subunit
MEGADKAMDKAMDRRGFITGACALGAVGAVAAAGMAVTACTADAPGTGTNAGTTEPTWDYEVDVAVAGFGIGGALASLTAQQEGATVLCVEAYSQVGGTSVDSGGGASAPASLDVARAMMPYGDPVLLEPFVDGMPKATELVVAIDAPVRPAASGSGFTIGAESTHESRLECFEFLAEAFTDGGGTLLMDTKAIKLLTDEAGTVNGMQARDKDGKILSIKAKAVILACGGFQNNAEMKTKYFGPYGDQCVCRSVPTNDGTGLLMAQEVGAGLSKSLGTFYGHSIASTIDVQFMEFSEIGSQYHDNRSIVVNLDGVRFADEGMGLAGDLCNESLVRQRWGRGCLIFDQFIYDEWGSTTAGGTPTGIDRTQEVLKRGGRVASADTIEELAEKVAAWGYNRASFIKTVTEYNAAVDAGTTADLPVPRTAGMIASIVKIAQPPFWATEVVGGVSCCFGGVAINAKTEVLKADGGAPIPGLYAIPGTAGGVTFVHYYVSSIGAAAAFGWASAQSAVQYANAQ